MNTTNNKSLLDVDQLSEVDIQNIINEADKLSNDNIESTKKYNSGKSVLTLFYENSTRTRTSFELAAKKLGADVINISLGSSSVMKGESLLNTVKTLESMQFDLIIVRHSDAGAPYFISRNIRIPVINAGDGLHAHPTQTLLDIYTIQKKLGTLKNKKISIIGDILHSRVARSNILGFSKLGANVYINSPKTLSLFKNKFFEGKNSLVNFVDDIDHAIENADVIMPLRIQLERQEQGNIPSLREYSKYWGINEEKIKIAKNNVMIMHPGPVNEGVEISSSLVHGDKSQINLQVKHGLFIRMAIIKTILSEANK